MKKYLLITLTALSVNAFAVDCKNTKTSHDTYDCISKANNEIKSEMNKAYNQIYAKTTAKDEFEAAQKAWLNYRNSQCVTFIATDSMYSPATTSLTAACESELNYDRLKYLKNLLSSY